MTVPDHRTICRELGQPCTSSPSARRQPRTRPPVPSRFLLHRRASGRIREFAAPAHRGIVRSGMTKPGLQAAMQQSDNGRASSRHKIFEPVLLSIGSENTDLRAHLINVSLSGALVHAATVPELGNSVQLQINEAWIVGQVMWVSARRTPPRTTPPPPPGPCPRIYWHSCFVADGQAPPSTGHAWGGAATIARYPKKMPAGTGIPAWRCSARSGLLRRPASGAGIRLRREEGT